MNKKPNIKKTTAPDRIAAEEYEAKISDMQHSMNALHEIIEKEQAIAKVYESNVTDAKLRIEFLTNQVAALKKANNLLREEIVLGNTTIEAVKKAFGSLFNISAEAIDKFKSAGKECSRQHLHSVILLLIVLAAAYATSMLYAFANS